MRAAPACAERSRDPDGDDEAHKCDKADAKRTAVPNPDEEASPDPLLAIPRPRIGVDFVDVIEDRLRFRLRLRLRGYRVAPLDEFRTAEAIPMFAQRLEVMSGVGMAALRSACEGLLGIGQSVRACEQHREFERAVGVAAVVRPAVRRCGSREISALLE